MVKRKGISVGGSKRSMLYNISKAAWNNKERIMKGTMKALKLAAAIKKSRGGSKTKPKTKVYKEEASDNHSGITARQTTITINPNKPKHDTGRWEYNQSHNFITTGAAGKQAVNWIAGITLNDQIVTSSGVGYNLFQNHTGLIQLNPYLVNTGSNLLPSRTPYTDKFLLQKVEFDMEFTNLTSACTTVDLYFISMKKGSTTDPAGIWSDALLKEGAGTGSMTYPAAGTTTGAVGYTTYENPYTEPNDCLAFKRQCTVLKKATFQMGPASVEVFKTNIIYNKIIKKDVIDRQITDGFKALPGIGIYVLAVARGAPIVDKTVELAPLMTYSAIQVGYITRTRYIMYSISGNAGRVDVGVSVTNISSGASKANQRMIDSEDVVSALDVVV